MNVSSNILSLLAKNDENILDSDENILDSK